MQEKLWKYTQIQTPLARSHPTPGEAAELPDMVVSKSWVRDWMLQLQGLSA